tara:strand:- start:7 stop:933 length:927 start_codon:yes stop_codon:yes gene_type:complete
MKILITGGTGMVGSAFKKINSEHEFVFVGSKDYNLVSKEQTDAMVRDVSPDAIIHLAAKVGGVKGNTVFVNDFYNQNIMMNTNILQIAHRHDVQKVISFLSTCVYPDKVTYPLTEDQIHNGPPHRSNFGYAYAKRMVDVHSRAMRQQHDRNYICAIPNNLYGPHDNFDLENGHVIPAIIRKIHEAKINSTPPIFWGSGSPLREFTYSEDIASILLLLLDKYDDPMPINIGNPSEISIKEIVDKISNILGYNGDIIWDTSKPEGQFRKPSSNERLLAICPELEYTSLQSGLEQTCEWFLEAYPNVRGVK